MDEGLQNDHSSRRRRAKPGLQQRGTREVFSWSVVLGALEDPYINQFHLFVGQRTIRRHNVWPVDFHSGKQLAAIGLAGTNMIHNLPIIEKVKSFPPAAMAARLRTIADDNWGNIISEGDLWG